MDARVHRLPFENAPTRPRMRELLRMRSRLVQGSGGRYDLSQGKEKLFEEAFLLLVCLLLSYGETP